MTRKTPAPICEWCLPGHRGNCSGERVCSWMAGYLEFQLKERLLCLCADMPRVRAARVPLECLVVALASAQALEEVPPRLDLELLVEQFHRLHEAL